LSFVIIVISFEICPTRTSVTDSVAARHWRRLRNANALTYHDIRFRTRWRIFRVDRHQQSRRKTSEVPGIRSLWLARAKSPRIRAWSCRMSVNNDGTKLFRASVSGHIVHKMSSKRFIYASIWLITYIDNISQLWIFIPMYI